jgi:hypothetical protein
MEIHTLNSYRCCAIMKQRVSIAAPASHSSSESTAPDAKTNALDRNLKRYVLYKLLNLRSHRLDTCTEDWLIDELTIDNENG